MDIETTSCVYWEIFDKLNVRLGDRLSWFFRATFSHIETPDKCAFVLKLELGTFLIISLAEPYWYFKMIHMRESYSAHLFIQLRRDSMK